MTIRDAILERSSQRDFLPDPIDRTIIEDLLRLGGQAPSGANMQPWLVYVVQNEALKKVSQAVLDHMPAQGAFEEDYTYYPTSWFAPYKQRRHQTGLGLYEVLGIARDEKEKRQAQWEKNFLWFGAPTVFFVCYDKRLTQGSFIDLGGFMQTICLGAMSYGLGTCIQASTAEYAGVIKKALDIPDTLGLAYSIVLGYPTKSAENSYKPDRVDIAEFATFLD